MVNNVEKDLHTLRAKNSKGYSEEDTSLSVAKQLLATNAQAEISTLLNLGISKELVAENKKRSINQERSSIEEMYGKTVFTEKEIAEIGKKYFLKLAHTNKFRGPIPADLGAVLVNFCNKNNINTSFSSEKNRFYILAPPRMFSDYVSFSDAHVEFFTDHLKTAVAIKESFIENFKDPQIFYCPDTQQSEKMFIHLKGWGGDFSFWRKIIGSLRRTPILPIIYAFSMMLLVTLGIEAGFEMFKPVVNTNSELYVVTYYLLYTCFVILSGALFISTLVYLKQGKSILNRACSNYWYD